MAESSATLYCVKFGIEGTAPATDGLSGMWEGTEEVGAAGVELLVFAGEEGAETRGEDELADVLAESGDEIEEREKE